MGEHSKGELTKGGLRNGKSKKNGRHGSIATIYYAGRIGTRIRGDPLIII
jgi:hypothetical protein